MYTEKNIYFDVDLRLPRFYLDLNLVKKSVYMYIHICYSAKNFFLEFRNINLNYTDFLCR